MDKVTNAAIIKLQSSMSDSESEDGPGTIVEDSDS